MGCGEEIGRVKSTGPEGCGEEIGRVKRRAVGRR